MTHRWARWVDPGHMGPVWFWVSMVLLGVPLGIGLGMTIDWVLDL